MYTIYIQNYKNASGTEIGTETRLYGIPISREEAEAGYPLTDPVVKTEWGKTGSFEFSMNPVHPFYNSMLQMKTVMRVDYAGTTLFRGRVLTIDNDPMSGIRKVHLEGDFAFLMDSVQEGTKEENRESVPVLTYIQRVIAEHNRQMSEAGAQYKRITVGEVPGHYSSAIDASQKITVPSGKFGSNSWEVTANALETLMKTYGGSFRTRYSEGTCYLDWLTTCYRYELNSQPIEIRENLISLNSSTEVNNLFTALIPIGKSRNVDLFVEGYREDIHGHNKRILVPQIVSLFSDAELNRGYHAKADYVNAVNNYGIIYKTHSFENADTQEKLWNYAIDWIKNNYVGGITSFDITALDMHHVDGVSEKYLVGDRVQVIYPDMSAHSEGTTPTISKMLTLMSAQYNLYNPEKNQYSVGVPSLLVDKKYGTAKKTSSGGGGYHKKKDDEDKAELEAELREFDELAWQYIVNRRYNGDIYDQLYADDPRKADYALNSTYMMIMEGLLADESRPTSGEHKKRLQKMWLDGVNNTIELSGPIDPSIQLTDEQIEKLNEHNQVLTLDALNQKISIKAAVDTTAGSFAEKTPEELALMKVGLTRSTSTSSENSQGFIQFWDSSKIQDSSAKPKTTLFGDGTINNMFTNLGKDGTGDVATIISDGVQAVQQMMDPSTVGTTGMTPEETIKMLGGIDPDYSGTGTAPKGIMQVGKNGNAWNVLLNKKISYTGFDGQPHETDGFVVSTDYKFDDNPTSLKTEIAAVDVLLADYAQIGTLVAMKADIEELKADSITATNLSASISSLPYIKTNLIKYNNMDVEWKQRYVVTQVEQDDQDLTITVTRRNIHYLGAVGYD